MKKLVYIDACMRGELSRTKKIATPIIEALREKYDVTTFVLNDLPLSIVQKELLAKRNGGDVDREVVAWAEQIRDADRLVIAAPFWDMSFPAALKNFLELCSLFNVTFKSNETTCYGNCKAEKVLYITTRGMDIDTGSRLEQATPYLKALSWLWGLGELQVISAQNMDYASEREIEEKICTAISKGLEIAKTF